MAGWAACLLADPEPAALAVRSLGDTPAGFRRLLASDGIARPSRRGLLRHPDLLSPVAALHDASLSGRLGPDATLVARPPAAGSAPGRAPDGLTAALRHVPWFTGSQ